MRLLTNFKGIPAPNDELFCGSWRVVGDELYLIFCARWIWCLAQFGSTIRIFPLKSSQPGFAELLLTPKPKTFHLHVGWISNSCTPGTNSSAADTYLCTPFGMSTPPDTCDSQPTSPAVKTSADVVSPHLGWRLPGRCFSMHWLEISSASQPGVVMDFTSSSTCSVVPFSKLKDESQMFVTTYLQGIVNRPPLSFLAQVKLSV